MQNQSEQTIPQSELSTDTRLRKASSEIGKICLLSFFLITPLLTTNWIMMGESIDQLVRVIETAHGLRELNLYPRWFADMAGGFGYPYFVFYAPLIYFVAASFHLVGLGIVAATKCMMILGVLLAGAGMYCFARLFIGPQGAIVAAMAYTYLPYRIVNLYIRGDLAEAFASALIPWVFFFLYTTVSRRHRLHLVGLAAAYAALIFTHNCTALTTSGMLAVFLLFILLAHKDFRGAGFGLTGLILGLGLSAIFWLPALIEKELVNISLIYSNPAFDFHNNFLSTFKLFRPVWSLESGIGGRDLPLQIGLPHVILTLLAAMAFLKNRSQVSPELSITFLFFCLSLAILVFLTNRASAFVWENVFLMRYLQFPWRLLAQIGFCVAFLAGSLFCFLPSASKSERGLLQLVLVIVLILYGGQYCYVKGYYILKESELTPDFVREQWSTASSYNTREMNRIQDFGEYLPKTVKKLPDKKLAGRVVVVSGQARINNLRTGIDSVSFEAVVSQEARLVIGQFYYPSWRVWANQKPIPLYTDEAGLIHIQLTQGNHDVVALFGDSGVRRWSAYLSALAAFLLMGILGRHISIKRARPDGDGKSQTSGERTQQAGLPEDSQTRPGG